MLVDVPVNDKNGRPLPVDRLSSGGARDPGGYLSAQYRNPRLPESAPTPFRRDKAIQAPAPRADPATEGPQVSDEEAPRAVELPGVSVAEGVRIDDYRDRRSA